MTVQRVAAVGFWIVIASSVAMGQQRDDRVGPDPNAPGETVVVRTYPFGGTVPSRTVETRSNSGGREVVTTTIHAPDLDGRLVPTRETTTETTRTGPAASHSRRDVSLLIPPAQRVLLETTPSEVETLPGGTTRTMWNTLARDLNGHLGVAAREIQHTTLISPDVKETDTSLLIAGINETLLEVERLQQTEREISADVHRTDGTRLVRDLNGRFQPAEVWSQEVRRTGPSEFVQEDTIHRPDINGKMTVDVRIVTHRVHADGSDQIVMETFSRNPPGLALSDNRLELSQRVRTTTTSAADGGDRTIEDVEERVAGSLGEPIRLVQRTVGTTSRVSAGQWRTERRVYAPDVNGRLALAIEENGEANGR